MNEQPSIGNNLKQLLRARDELTLSELARRTQIPQPTLHHLLDGTTKKPRRGVLEKLASFFSVTVQQLTGSIPLSHTIPESFKKNLNISAIPVINWDTALLWPELDKSSMQTTEIILNKPVSDDAFALVADDDRFEPMFPEKSILIFDPAQTPQDRDFALIQLSESNQLVFNRLFTDQGGFFIKQENEGSNTQLIKVKPNVDKILGRLIEVRLQF